MQSKQLKAWALATTLLSGAGLSAPAFAQDADEADTTDRVVVTGSRLQTNPNLVAASPVLSVSGEEADIRGNIRIEDFVNILPQVFAGQASEVSNGASGTANLNLRGLGANRTLVLIDGRRLPYGSSQTSAPNLDIIPTQLVERVDILTGGASAVYGSDAVAGVANFILVDDFEGLEIHAQTSISNSPNGNDLFDNVLRAGGVNVPGEVWDGAEYSLSVTLGANSDDGRGNATIFASYENREAISQEDRSISSCALGQASGAGSFGGFGCVGSGNFRAFGGDGGFGFQQEDGTIVPFVGGPAQTYNFGPRNYFQRPSERFSIYGRAHYDVTDNLRAFADISFVQNLSNAQIAETASFGSWDINCDNPLLQGSPGLNIATDLFDCSAADIANGTIKNSLFASHRNVEGGPRNSDLENMAWRFVGGLEGTFASHWDWEAFFQYTRTDDTQISKNDFIGANVQQAFLAVDDGAGDVVCQDPSGGCVPYNIFQRGPSGESLITPAQTNFLQGTGIITGVTEQQLFGADVQADLGNYGISSPFSDLGVGLLIGFEQRKDQLTRDPDEIFQVDGGGFTGLGGATKPVRGELEVFEIFSEVQVPLVTGAQFAEELTFSAQYRYSDYDTQGGSGTAFSTNSFSTDSYALQLAWAPVSDIRFRAQFQQAVRAPNVIELYTAQDVGLPNLSAFPGAGGAFDPCSGANPALPLAKCALTGVTAAQYGVGSGILDVISGQTQAITGGNPGLQPETAETITLGMVFTPSYVDNLSISVDYFDIVVEDAVGSGATSQTILNECLATGSTEFCSLVSRAANGTLASGFGTNYGFIQTNLNAAELSTRGVDVQVVYSMDLEDMAPALAGYGGLRFDYAATFLTELNEIAFTGADTVECAGFFGNACGTPGSEYRHRFMATWEAPWDFEIAATWRHFSGTDNDNAAETLETDIPAMGYLDLSGNYRALDNVVLRGGVLNAFAEQAPVFTSAGPPLGNGNTYPTVFDTSRVFFASVTASF